MGSYSTFELIVTYRDMPTPEEAISTLLRENDEAAYALDENGKPLQNAKWYTYHEDIQRLSRQFPHLNFCLEVRGEESYHAKVFANNGESEEVEPEVTFQRPEFWAESEERKP